MIESHDQETIISQCTPHGSGAIALLRISGEHAIVLVDRISRLVSNKKLVSLPTHTIHYGSIVDKENIVIDHTLFLLMKGSRTFTGQNTVEITCHNNPFIIENIIERAIQEGARIAQPGEFSQRAVSNNKIDLAQAEAINELISANTQLTLKKALAQLKGTLSHWIEKVEKKLISALALSEASFEFIDEEDMEFGTQIKNIIKEILISVDKVKKEHDQLQQIRDGIRIGIIGSVNSGKSSLFNALLKKDRAIVTPIAGTTRDSIEAGLYRNGNYWTLVDTAGLRKTDDRIEEAGIKRSFQTAATADIILLVYDGSRAHSDQESSIYTELFGQYKNKIILIKNKTDLSQQNAQFLENEYIETSATTNKNIDRIEQAIQEKIEQIFAAAQSPFLLNKRQFNLICSTEKKLQTTLSMFDGEIAYELVSYHLKDLLSCLSELSGKSISEAAMDAVFREFCIGK